MSLLHDCYLRKVCLPAELTLAFMWVSHSPITLWLTSLWLPAGGHGWLGGKAAGGEVYGCRLVCTCFLIGTHHGHMDYDHLVISVLTPPYWWHCSGDGGLGVLSRQERSAWTSRRGAGHWCKIAMLSFYWVTSWFNQSRDNLMIICHALTGGCDIKGWSISPSLS